MLVISGELFLFVPLSVTIDNPDLQWNDSLKDKSSSLFRRFAKDFEEEVRNYSFICLIKTFYAYICIYIFNIRFIHFKLV